MEVQLKMAMENDRPQLLAIGHAAAAADESTWDLNYPNAEILEEDIRGHRLYRITANGETAGLLAVGDFGELDMLSDPSDGPHPYDLARFGLHPAYQGKGLAQKAICAALSLCWKSGATAVRLLVSPGNPPALAVYKKAGFERIRLVHLWENDYWYFRKIRTQTISASAEEA